MTLTVSSVMPDVFVDQALLIWGNGQWLVEAEALADGSSARRDNSKELSYRRSGAAQG
jgi:hypothetical protein